jgi:hypothetical protein
VAGLSLAFVHEDLPSEAPANSTLVTMAACFAMTMSSSIAGAKQGLQSFTQA